MRLPSPAMIVALIALAVAMGGTSYAVTKLPRNSVGSKQIRAGGVRAGDIGTGAVGARQLRDGVITRTKLAPGTIPNLSPSPPGKAPDSDKLDGKDSSAFLATDGIAADAARLNGRPANDYLLADGIAPDSNKLDGRDSTDFLLVDGKAADADKLDGLDSAAIGIGWFTGRITDLPALGIAGIAGAASGVSSGIGFNNLSGDHDRRSLGPSTAYRARDLSVVLSAPTTFSRQVALNVGSPTISGGVLSCVVPAGGTTCSAAGPSPVIPAPSTVAIFVGGSGAEPIGNDVMFSWRATAP